MLTTTTSSKENQNLSLLSQRGVMAQLVRDYDWSKTPLGAISSWPFALVTAVDIMLSSCSSMLLVWDNEKIVIYNDACIPMLGSKHPQALGKSAKEISEEIWLTMSSSLTQVTETEKPALSTNQLLPVERNNAIEECYFTCSYSPIRSAQNKMGGVLISITETTDGVLAKRRLQILRDLDNNCKDSQTVEEASKSIFKILTKNPTDFSSAFLYLSDITQKQMTLKEAIGIMPNSLIAPLNIALPALRRASLKNASLVENSVINPEDLNLKPKSDPSLSVELTLNQRFISGIVQALQNNRLIEFEKLQKEKNELSSIVVLPLNSKKQNVSRGVLALEINPLIPFDEDNRTFVELLTGKIANSISSAVARPI